MRFLTRRLTYLNLKALVIAIFSIFNLISLPYLSELQAVNGSLRYRGNGGNGSSTEVDRVKIKIDNPSRPADIGSGDFTMEFWMRATPGANSDEGPCIEGNDGWIEGVIMFDRDIFGAGDFGDFGISLFNNGIAFGVAKGAGGAGICSSQNLNGNSINLENNEWHHIAVTRRSFDGQMRIFIDGLLKAEGFGPTGNISYRNGRSTAFPNSDPYLVIGAEKHNLLGYPSFNGWIDEVHLSNKIRYTANFIRPIVAFSKDSNTKALYHFSEGSGNTINDSAEDSKSKGTRKFGGSPPGPEWSLDEPFWPKIQLNQIVSGLISPVYLTHAGDGSGRIFIVEQPGRILILQGGSINSTPFLDITPIVLSGGEQGLLSVAFSPNYLNTNNGFFYVYYTDLNGNNVVARYSRSSGDPDLADPTSAQILMTVNHPGQSNHNGGQVAFGPEGYLYIGPGDGGGGGDPNNNAQNKNTFLGKILRIIVEEPGGDPLTPYQIPPNNPFVGASGLDEIWALGLRNPWRFSFDVHPQSLNPGLYIGDVGQSQREEIDFETYPSSGKKNYGWRILEGSRCFRPSSNCIKPSNYNKPVAQYDHNEGCSVTGGFVYRGTEYPRMQGTYFFGDYCSGKIWGLKKGKSWSKTLLTSTSLHISSFGVDEDGNLYVVDHNGAVYKVTDVPSSS